MRALVLGGTGFVGMNLLRALVREGHEVAGTRRKHANILFARKLGAKLVHADLDDEASLVEAMSGREVVFHCAGYYPRFSLQLDEQVALAREQTRRVLRAARRAGVDRIVLTSSVATVGPPRGGRKLSNESDPMSPAAKESVYFAIKHVIETTALEEAGPVDIVVTLPTGIFGELDVKAGTGFVIVALGNDMLPFYVQGKTNVVDADDLAAWHILAAERGVDGERYILGGHNTTIRDLLQVIAERLDARFYAWRLPLALAGPLATLDEIRCHAVGRGCRPFIPREFVDVVRFGQWVDTSFAEKRLGLPPPTPLLATIDKACAWYERFRYVPKRGGRGSQRRNDSRDEKRTHRSQVRHAAN